MGSEMQCEVGATGRNSALIAGLFGFSLTLPDELFTCEWFIRVPERDMSNEKVALWKRSAYELDWSDLAPSAPAWPS
jgi:hypothetical protein